MIRLLFCCDQSMAKALFGSGEATGKTMKFDDSTVFRVAGVIPDLPYNSEFKDVNFFVPWENYRQTHPWVKDSETYWNDQFFPGICVAAGSADAGQVEAKVKQNWTVMGLTDKSVVVLHPMEHWHLYNNCESGKNVRGSISLHMDVRSRSAFSSCCWPVSIS